MSAARNGTPELVSPEMHRQACRYARWLVGNEFDAEEIVQDAWCKLASRSNGQMNSLDHDNPSALLFTMVRNQSIDFLRRQKHRRSISLGDVPDPGGKDNCRNAGELHDLQSDVERAFAALPENQAEALRLKVAGELSYSEIAEVLGCTHAQVRTWIFRARRQLTTELAVRGWLEPDERPKP